MSVSDVIYTLRGVFALSNEWYGKCLAAFVAMRLQGINANIMSLGGIAIAIGAMVDAFAHHLLR